MSTLKADTLQAKTTDGTLTLSNNGTGKVELPSDATIGGTAMTGSFTPYVAPGTSGNLLTSNGSAWTSAAAAAGGFTLGTEQATTSGTGVTFTGIPAGTTMIVVSWEGVSLSSASAISIQIGDSGGIETSGYTLIRALIAHNISPIVGGGSAGFDLLLNNAAASSSGQMTLTLKDATNFTWVGTGIAAIGSPSSVSVGGAVKSLTAELTQLKFMPLAGNFDAGSVNIMYQ